MRSAADDVSGGKVVSDFAPTERFMNIATFANVAHISKGSEGRWQGRGDPTEIAIQGRNMTIGTKASVDSRRSPSPDERKITYIGPDSGQMSVA